MLRRNYIVIFFFFYVSANTNENNRCRTPNGEDASCESLYECPPLLQSLASKDPVALEFVRQSECGHFLVCCGRTGTFSPVNNQTTERATTAKQQTVPTSTPSAVNKTALIPDKRYCGLQHTDDRFNHSTSIELDEFPWLVLLRDPNNNNRACSGALLNTKYVLTSANCFTNVGNITIAHVGVFNKEKNYTCIEDEHYPECTDPVLEIAIEKVIIHEQYDWNLSTSPDIMLVRLAKKLTYTDYLRPICLPFSWSVRPRYGALLVSSGWGPLHRLGKPVDIKKRVWHKITLGNGCPFRDNLICTFIEHSTNRACGNDVGGPLMWSYNHQWFVEGILSATVNEPCSQFTVSTRVTKYIDWILDNIEP